MSLSLSSDTCLTRSSAPADNLSNTVSARLPAYTTKHIPEDSSAVFILGPGLQNCRQFDIYIRIAVPGLSHYCIQVIACLFVLFKIIIPVAGQCACLIYPAAFRILRDKQFKEINRPSVITGLSIKLTCIKQRRLSHAAIPVTTDVIYHMSVFIEVKSLMNYSYFHEKS